MKQRFWILLLAAVMLLGACAPERADVPGAPEQAGAVGSLPETEVTPEAADTAPPESAAETEGTPDTEDAAETGAFKEFGSIPSGSILLDPAALRPEGGSWALGGIQVYFGQYDGSPMAYRVLSPSDTQAISAGEDCLLLDCGSVLLLKEFDDNYRKNDGQSKLPNEWKGSDIEAWLNGSDFYGNSSVFSDVEKTAVARAVLDENSAAYTIGNWTYEDFGSTDHVFLLSAGEAERLYADNAARAKTGSSESWWLRSSFDQGGNGAGSIHGDGHICNNSITNFAVGVSPALNVRLSSILFVSAVGTNQSPDQAEEEAGAAGTAWRDWKLTLLDPGKTITVTDGRAVARADTEKGVVITVPYTCAGSGVTQISVMITDRACTDSGAQVLYYGALQAAPAGPGAGTGSFTLPAELEDQVCGTDYFAYILAEDVNGSRQTDYASGFYPILIPPAR